MRCFHVEPVAQSVEEGFGMVRGEDGSFVAIRSKYDNDKSNQRASLSNELCRLLPLESKAFKHTSRLLACSAENRGGQVYLDLESEQDSKDYLVLLSDGYREGGREPVAVTLDVQVVEGTAIVLDTNLNYEYERGDGGQRLIVFVSALIRMSADCTVVAKVRAQQPPSRFFKNSVSYERSMTVEVTDSEVRTSSSR